MSKRLSMLVVACAIGGCVWASPASSREAPVPVPQSGHFSVRPQTLRFSYQAPGSYGDEERKGLGLYPPFRITGLTNWRSWRRFPRMEAVAVGWLHYDSCEPDCLRGRYKRIRARVELDGDNVCTRRGHALVVLARVTVTPRGMPTRKRFIQCSGKVRSGARKDAIPAGIGFYR